MNTIDYHALRPWWKVSLKPLPQLSIDTNGVELDQQVIMWNAIKGFTQVKIDNISLKFSIHIMKDFQKKNKELLQSRSSTKKTELKTGDRRRNKINNAIVDQFLQDFGDTGKKRNRPIVRHHSSITRFKNRCDTMEMPFWWNMGRHETSTKRW